MIDKEIWVGTFAEFAEVMERYSTREYLFRGVSRVEYALVPRIGRVDNHRYPEFMTYETELMTLFKRSAVPYIGKLPSNEWEIAAIAQHHGLPTRLLDWTRNPIVAAFFAIRTPHDTDAAIYALHTGQEGLDRVQDHELEPYIYEPDLDHIVLIFEPNHIIPRIVVQNGCFTVHGNPRLALNEHPNILIDRIIVESHFREELKRILDMYGVNNATLFPGLDGLCDYLDWYTREPVY